MLRGTTINPQAAQKNLLLLEKLYPNSLNNHRSVAVEITGEIDLAKLQQAFNYVVERHEMLRAVVQEDATGQVFKILDRIDHAKPIHLIDVPALPVIPPPEELFETLKQLHQEKFITTPFDLKQGPLWRSALVRFAPNKYQFVMLFNHIIVDEGSIGVIFKDLSACYNSLIKEDKLPDLPPVKPLGDLRFDLQHEEKMKRVGFWEKKLAHFNTTTLQTDSRPQKQFQFKGKRHRFSLPKSLIAPLEQNAQFQGCSLNQILLANLYALLFRYSGETDICLGITSSNRRHEGIEEKDLNQAVNCFFNSVPLRLIFNEKMSFTELLAQVKTALSDALKNQLPLDVVLHSAVSSDTKTALTTASLFNILLVLNRKKPTLTLDGTTATPPVELDLGLSKFPYFGINLDELDDGYQCFLEFNTDLFSEKTISRLVAHFKKSLQYIAANPTCNIAAIPLLTDDDKALIYKFNETAKPPVTELLVPDFFHAQALKFPDEIALAYHSAEYCAPVRMTYKELDEETTRLANYLKQKGVGPGSVVGVCLTRSNNLIIGILAALKTGATFVPIEAEPNPALAHKIETTGVSTILVDNTTKALFPNPTKVMVNLQNPKTNYEIHVASATYQRPAITAESIAYDVHTSGTTGELLAPKGVSVSHRSFANQLNSMFDQGLPDGTKVICTALPTFDAFFFDLLAAIATHGQLHLCFQAGRYSPQILERIIRREGINFGVFLPHILTGLNPQLPLEQVISMGGIPYADDMEIWADARPNRIFYNGLGHTETGVRVSGQRYSPNQEHTLTGPPIRNMQIFILNPANLSLCPPGVPGEIYVAGPGLAEGYIGNPELTQEKFPLVIYDQQECIFRRVGADQKGNPEVIRLYATGDYGCYREIEHGALSINFMGRKDRQIKICGVRVDLDDIETILRRNPLIKNVVVLANNTHTALTAYIVPATSDITLNSLCKHVRKQLTETLLPSVAYPKNFYIVPELPLTANGKINFRELPTPSPVITHFPQLLTPLHLTLRKIWSKVLGIEPEERININESFKELGGNSLSLATLETELNKKDGAISREHEYIGINILSQHMTIASLAEKIEILFKPTHSPTEPPQNPVLGPGVSLRNGGTVVLFPRSRSPDARRPVAQDPPTQTNKATGYTLGGKDE